jgi:hypothetical protein
MVCALPNRAACLPVVCILRSNESRLRLNNCIDIQYNLRRIDTNTVKKISPLHKFYRVFLTR